MEIARKNHNSLVLSDGSLLVMGGGGSNLFNDVWKSADGGSAWILVTDNAPWKGEGTTDISRETAIGGNNYTTI
jgi:hypothetical protein